MPIRRMVISKIIENRYFNSIIMLLYLCSRKSKTEIYRSILSNSGCPTSSRSWKRKG